MKTATKEKPMISLKENLDVLQAKAKERTVKTQNIEYDLETLVKKIERKIIQLNPDYQRHHRWSDEVSSRLIESLILNIPVPLIYISQDVDVDLETDDEVARYSVIDGQQRLTAIFRFLKNEYPLTELEVLRELNGSLYRDLPPFLVRRLEERTIKCLRIDSTLDNQVKYDIFERLNSGSIKLEPQELRNATCRGAFKELLKKLVKNEDFVELAKLDPNGARVKKMEDEELVLRFFAMAYNDGYREYRSGFHIFLTEKMAQFNKTGSSELKQMEDLFVETMKAIKLHFGPLPFSKYAYKNGEFSKMSNFNAAVFDSVTVYFSKVVLGERKPIDYPTFQELFKDEDFFSAVEGSTSDAAKLDRRIKMALEVKKS